MNGNSEPTSEPVGSAGARPGSGDGRLVRERRAGPGRAGRRGHPAEGQGQALHEIATCGHEEALTRSSPMPELR